jgi:ATP-dependent 26S proteasome regulatory subunit
MIREIQRTLMELLNQLDGFEVLSKVKIIMATNRYSAMIASDGDLCNMINVLSQA